MTSDPPERRTVKVRIAVAVSATGAWNAAGWHGGNDGNFTEIAGDLYDGSEPAERVQIHFVTADVPLPEATEIGGTVEAGGQG